MSFMIEDRVVPAPLQTLFEDITDPDAVILRVSLRDDITVRIDQEAGMQVGCVVLDSDERIISRGELLFPE